MGVYPVTLSLLAQLSFLVATLVGVRPATITTSQSAKRSKPAMRGTKKKGSPESTDEPCLF